MNAWIIIIGQSIALVVLLWLYLRLRKYRSMPFPRYAQVTECVNYQYLEILFKGLPKEDLTQDFFEDKLKPALTAIEGITGAYFTPGRDGNIDAMVTVSLENPFDRESAIHKLRAILPKVFCEGFETYYKPLSILEYM